ncbi:MAG: beta-eliminating lyase-related protein [Myxococcota bacterium]
MNREPRRLERACALEAAGHNLSLLPDSAVEIDCVTDSLMHRAHPLPVRPSARGDRAGDVRDAAEAFARLLGFPHVLLVSQGRLAEALLSNALVRAGNYIPASALFPTTRIHQERNGATVVDVMSADATGTSSSASFKGDLDIESIERVIRTYGAKSVPFIYVEPCNNATGGHPVSMQNMRSIHELARYYSIPVYLDACRVVDNAVMIQRREFGYSDSTITDILLEFCSLATGCTLSATKDFSTSIGGVLATRDQETFERCQEGSLLFGNGLSHANLACIAQAVANPDEIVARVAARVERVATLHAALADDCGLQGPAGGHALFVDVDALELDLSRILNPSEAFLHAVFEECGVRGAVNMSSRAAEASGKKIVRFAIPILGFNQEMLNRVAIGIRTVVRSGYLPGLELVVQPRGTAGAMRARYRQVEVQSS